MRIFSSLSRDSSDVTLQTRKSGIKSHRTQNVDVEVWRVFLVCKDSLIIYTNVAANWRGGLRLVLSGDNQA